MTWPAIAIWIMIAAAFFARGPLPLFYLFFLLGPVGTLVMIPGNLVGGTNLLPQSFCAVFLLVKILIRSGNAAKAISMATKLRSLGFLSLFLAWGLFSAYAMPRFFAGRVNVIPISAVVPDPQPLVPTTTNLTQSAYMILSAGLVYACAVAARSRQFRGHFLRANLLAAIVLVLTGLLDLATQGTELLAPFRNANYALLTDVEILGSKRIVGLMPEASAYGGYCVGILSTLLFLRSNFERYSRTIVVPATIAALVVMTLMSTSSTGYVGLAVLALCYSASLLWRLQFDDVISKKAAITEIIILICVGLIVVAAFATNTALYDSASNLINVLIFQKTQSASYLERSAWTQYAWSAFIQTSGWGVGLGSARASSWYYSILSNTGILGAALLLIFFFQTFLRQTSRFSEDAHMLWGLKFAIIPNLVMAGLAGTTPDIGAQNAIQYGVITALSQTAREDDFPTSGPMSSET